MNKLVNFLAIVQKSTTSVDNLNMVIIVFTIITLILIVVSVISNKK